MVLPETPPGRVFRPQDTDRRNHWGTGCSLPGPKVPDAGWLMAPAWCAGERQASSGDDRAARRRAGRRLARPAATQAAAEDPIHRDQTRGNPAARPHGTPRRETACRPAGSRLLGRRGAIWVSSGDRRRGIRTDLAAPTSSCCCGRVGDVGETRQSRDITPASVTNPEA
jgi:hypothetical protein